MPSFIPFRGYEFDRDQVYGIEDPMRYSLSQGIELDREVFAAFTKEFRLVETENIQGTRSSMLVNQEQLQIFAEFHAAFRYAKEIRQLERKSAKATEEKQRIKIEKQIEKRKASKAYQQFGQIVEKYVK